jgi:hypothetical protein
VDEESAALAMADECVSNQQLSSALAFSFPGNGRRAFAQRVAAALYGRGFDVIWVDVQALIARKGEAVRRDLRQVRERLGSRPRPVLLVVNGVDLIDVGLKNNGALTDVHGLLDGCFGGRYPPPLLVLATAKSPGAAMKSLPRNTGLLYFPWPREKKAAELLQLAGIPESSRVAKELFSLADSNGARYTTGSLINAAKEAMRIAADRLGGMTPQERAQITVDLCTPTPKEEAEKYERANKRYIEKAQLSVEPVGTALRPTTRAIVASTMPAIATD